MFKFLFRLLLLVLVLIAMTIGVAFWKGGEPFRIAGEGISIMGEAVTKFGNAIDGIREGGKRVGRQIDSVKETFESVMDDDVERDEAARKNGATDKSNKPE